MDRRTMAALELPALLRLVAGFAMTRPGAEMVRGLKPSPDVSLVERRCRRLAQLRDLLKDAQAPALEGLEDAPRFFGRLKVEGAFLSVVEIEALAGFVASAGGAASFLAGSGETYDELFRLGNSITPLPELARHLRRIVGPGNSVASSASPELGRVRRELNRARARLSVQLKEVMGRQEFAGSFSDNIVTQRADRYVVPVKTDAKNRVGGIIHDTSGSGATCFVEPLEAVEGNNQLAMLRRREREEEERVLKEAARLLAGHLPVLQVNLAALTKLDCLLAQAAFCNRLDCTQPSLNTVGDISLVTVRHPLLAWRSGAGGAVPINVEFTSRRRVLMVSGANAGGKTVTLKTVGLITLMVMCGLHAPLDRLSRVCVFKQVMADVGDEQDLGRDLSTFTAHAGRLAAMTAQGGTGSLLLIDELGGGTDPGEGSALGMAVLDWLSARGAKVLCTTHYHALKAYAAASEGAENVSVAFDKSSGQPTYQLRYGLPGFSDALAVSRRLGFPRELVDAAEGMLDQSERRTVALLEEAERIHQEALADRTVAAAERRAAAAEGEKAREFLDKARREKAGAASDGRRRVRQVAQELEAELKELLSAAGEEKARGEKIKPGKVAQELYKKRRAALAKIDKLAADGLDAPAPGAGRGKAKLAAGAMVRLVSLDQKGRLLEDPAPGAEAVPVSVGVAGVRVMAQIADLELLQGETPKAAPVRVSLTAKADDGLDVKLVGMRVADALEALDKAVDQAALAARKRMKVIHGRGTGRLRAAVREYLTSHPLVHRVREGERTEGGTAVTIAELR